MIRSISQLLTALLFVSASFLHAEELKFPGKETIWNGYKKYDFEVGGKQVLVVAPKKEAPGRPWVWHGEFFGHKPAPDIALLDKGFHIVYMRVQDMLGAPQAVKYWDSFYNDLTTRYGFSSKVALVGLSRGGLYCYNWAAANPSKVSCIYADAPVCDFKSWPGGKGKGKGSPRDWKLVLDVYGFKNEREALDYKFNPIDNLKPLADAKVPLLHVFGDADDVVPWEENTGIIEERYKKMGGEITLIRKKGIGHHPHGLDDPTPIVDFIIKHSTIKTSNTNEVTPVKAELLKPRDGTGNFIHKLITGQPVKIAYFGGSITAAPGWRIKSREWFSKQYPKCKIEEIHAAIGGTGSDLGAFRIQKDALNHNPDLLFIEFAVNDGNAAPQRIWQGMEGIIRQTWIHSPKTDICFVYTFRTGYEKELALGLCPNAASTMEMLADHYGIPSINVALKITQLQQQGKLIYQSETPAEKGAIRFSSDGVHPLDEGHQIYADVIAEAFQKLAASRTPIAHSIKTPFIKTNWEHARMVSLAPSMLKGDWKALKKEETLAKNFQNRLGTIYEASSPGASIAFKFKGSTAKLYDLIGPDGGQVVITIDEKSSAKPTPRFDSHCTYHRITTLNLAEGLDPEKEHSVKVEIHPEQPDRSSVSFRLKNPAFELKTPKYQGTNIRVGQILLIGSLVE